MGNMYSKIIAFALFHLYFAMFAKLIFFSQYFIFFCNSFFFLQKAHLFFSILSFLFAKLYFILQNVIILQVYVALNGFHSAKQYKAACANKYRCVQFINSKL